MEQPVFAGVQNVSGKSITVLYGGRPVTFAKDEVRVLEASQAYFFSERKTRYASDGKVLSIQRLFKSIPLHDALKLAKEPENPSVAAARAKAEADEAATKALEDKILARFKAEGWKQSK